MRYSSTLPVDYPKTLNNLIAGAKLHVMNQLYSLKTVD